eukprot:1113971-Rhodomonas_salina.1
MVILGAIIVIGSCPLFVSEEILLRNYPGTGYPESVQQRNLKFRESFSDQPRANEGKARAANGVC